LSLIFESIDSEGNDAEMRATRVPYGTDRRDRLRISVSLPWNDGPRDIELTRKQADELVKLIGEMQ